MLCETKNGRDFFCSYIPNQKNSLVAMLEKINFVNTTYRCRELRFNEEVKKLTLQNRYTKVATDFVSETNIRILLNFKEVVTCL